MIYLITGLPGDGKTNYAVSLVKARAEKEKRTVYYNAAPNDDPEQGGMVILDPVALPWKPIDPKEWFNAPVGSIIFIDECQHIFEPRKRGDTQPEFAKRLENHRKAGHDLYLITQHPSFIDSHDRKLVEEHTHTVRKFGTSWITRYTWKGYRDQPQLPAARKDAKSESQHLLNKDAFKWYLSTQVNTSKVRIPFKFMLLVFLVVAIPLGSWWWFDRQSTRFAPQPIQTASAGSPGAIPGGSSGKAGPLTPTQYVEQFNERVPGLAYTAPAYDEVTKPVEAPYPAACVVMAGRCGCYTQQATKLQTPDALCRAIVDGGFFVAWDQKRGQKPVQDVAPKPLGVENNQAGMGVPASFSGSPDRMVPAPAPGTFPAVVDQGTGRGRNLPAVAAR